MMVEFLTFLFARPEHFFGFLVLLIVVCITLTNVANNISTAVLSAVVFVIRKSRDKSDE